ncbi:IS21 family transposase, partial [Thermincola ferriacetica]|uniref:IS21 family transposase n=1 Tax=Thermincola ferriacetica TaxID=281456 RepID=UPI003D02EF6F
MYSRIHQLKESGFKKARVAKKLGIDVKTVKKYWNMSPEDYHQLLVNSRQRPRYLEQYEKEILGWLTEHPDMTSAQVHDWLKERYPDSYHGKDRTVRDFVHKLRAKHNIPKSAPARHYQAVADPPMGYQAQVDFGEKVVYRADGSATKLYCMGMVLSHSRYKYAEWWDKPLTTAKLVEMLNHAFEYFGGVPKELVFDQDKIVAVSENYGDVIYTHEFERYRQATKFKVHLCRAADPESKGKVETVVKYVKNNFAAHRIFVDLASFNTECLEWLDRTGNANIHGITKRIPAEVFFLEKQYLQPISPQQITSANILPRGVRKDNTIIYQSNRYSVPLGTYQPGKKLFITEEDGNLVITEPETGQVVAIHRICHGKGQLIQNTNHLRDHSDKISGLQAAILDLLGGGQDAETLLNMIKLDKPRYVRDQFLLIKSVVTSHSPESIK